MKRKITLALLCLLVLLVSTACRGQAPAEVAGRTILSMGPSNTEILVALGFGDQIIGIDTFSGAVEGVRPDLPAFDMMMPDVEQMIALAPDVIFATGMTQVEGLDPFEVVSEAGIEVVHVPVSASIAEIWADIRLIAAALGAEAAGEAMIEEMEREIDLIRSIALEVTEVRTVYFEIAAPPFMYSFGRGVFLHEMIELIGAVNAFADQNAWFFVADEAVLEVNPDVILTNVGYIDDPVGDILARSGWGTISAVADGRVYFIDPDSSSRPSHHIVRALWEMARAVYPELFA